MCLAWVDNSLSSEFFKTSLYSADILKINSTNNPKILNSKSTNLKQITLYKFGKLHWYEIQQIKTTQSIYVVLVDGIVCTIALALG